MHRRLLSMAAVALFVAACGGGTATPSASESAAASSAPPSSSAASPSPSAPATPSVDIVETAYKPTPAAKTGGTVVMAEWQFPDSLNYYYQSSVASTEALFPTSNGLWRIAPDFKYYPDLTKDVPTVANGGVVVNGDKMDLKVNLKDGMKWSDGSPIQCDDVIATWKWIMDKDQVGLVGGTIGWEDIGSIDGAGTTSCVIHYNKVYEGYLTLIDPVYSAKWLQSVPVKDAPTKLNPLTNWKTAISSGPYIVSNVKTNAEIDYAPNPNWATIGGHAPYLDKLIFKYYTDADAELAGYKNGEFDVGNDFNHADLPKLAGLPQNEVVALDALQYELNQLNNASLAKKFGAADVPTIKKAILLSYNKSEITDRILGGTVKPSSNFLSPVLWYYKDEPQTTQDFAQANSLLDQAGWVKGSDGIRAKNGVKLQILACTTTRQYRIDTLTLVASWLKQIGIQVTVKPVPAQPDFFGGWNQASKDTPCNLQHGNYDLGEFAWSYSPDPIVSYNVYHSSGIPDNPPHSGQNTTRTNDPAVDKAYDTVKGSVDPAVIKQAMYDFQDLYAKDIIEIPLFNWKEVWLVNPKLQNFVANPTQYTAEWNTGDWWVQQ